MGCGAKFICPYRPAGSHTAVYGSAENFIGRVRVDPLFNADNDIRVSAAYVTFEPGARSAWHTHPAGQRLIVTSGVGLTQQEGKPVQVIRAGDVISCPADVKHCEGSNTASGLGIEILDGNMRPVKLNDLHAGMQWIPLVPEQNNILPYSARLKSTQKSVNPGLVSASATFTLEFQ